MTLAAAPNLAATSFTISASSDWFTVTNTPRMSRMAIRSLARISSFSARSLTLMPSVTVISRVMGSGSWVKLAAPPKLRGGTKPFIGPSLVLGYCCRPRPLGADGPRCGRGASPGGGVEPGAPKPPPGRGPNPPGRGRQIPDADRSRDVRPAHRPAPPGPGIRPAPSAWGAWDADRPGIPGGRARGPLEALPAGSSGRPAIENGPPALHAGA